MLETLELRSAPRGRPLPPVEPPLRLPKPTFGFKLDGEYVTAPYETLTRGDKTARQLDRCIQWMVLAWSNAEVVAKDARVLAFRAAVDVLLGGGAKTRQLGSALSSLLDDQSDTRTRRWNEHCANKSAEMDDTEWWFQSMALLRNAIAHGDEIEPEQWLFDDGQEHLWHADDRLRLAIKRTVINTGQGPDLILRPGERELRRAYAALTAEWASENAAASEQ